MGRGLTPERLALAVVASTLLLLACSVQVEDRSLSRIKKAGVIVVGIDPSYPPFENVDGQGQLVGYDVELAEDVARRIGVSAEFVSMDIGSVHDGLLAKKFDVIISSLPPFPEFTKNIAYSRPYFNAGQVLVVDQNVQEVGSLDDLAGETIGVEGASTGDLEVRRLVSPSMNVTIKPYSTAEMLVPALKTKEVDAAVVDVVTAMEFVRSQRGIKTAGRPLTVEPYVIAVRRPDALLLKEINSMLSEMESDGTLDRLWHKWLVTG